jgi:hypothetical protein
VEVRWSEVLRVFALAGACAAGGAGAAETSATFGIHVTLNNICVSALLSAQTHAQVKVFCPTGQFVQIEAAPDQSFLGTHGSAFRFNLPANALPTGVVFTNSDAMLGSGTIASLRITNLQETTVSLADALTLPEIAATARHPELAGGSVTSMRVYNTRDDGEPVELLVSF